MVTKEELYDALLSALRDYEDGGKEYAEKNLYGVAVYIQNNWDDIVKQTDGEKSLYDLLSFALTDYEEGTEYGEQDLYDAVLYIQKNWGAILNPGITPLTEF